MSLRLRLSIAYAIAVAVAVTVLGTVLYLSMKETLSVETDRRLQVRAGEVQIALWPGPNSPTAASLTPGEVDLSPLSQIEAASISVLVFDSSGDLLAASETLRSLPLPLDEDSFQRAVNGRRNLFDLTLPSGRMARVLSDPIWVNGKVAGVLQIVQPRDILQETLAGLRRLLLLLGGATVLIAGSIGWFVSYRGLRPLNAISEQAADIAVERNFSRRLKLASPHRDEVGKLAWTIDELLDKVEDTLRVHREFVADTSHELRNPLLALRTNLELLERVRDAAAREECVREAVDQVERMSRLVSDLLLLAQVESRLVLDQGPVNVVTVAERALRDAQQRAGDRELVLSHTGPALVMADATRLQQILANLLDNAIKFTPATGTIRIGVDKQDRGVTLTVEDTGEGIAPEHLPHIFERAYRAVPGQKDGTSGYGLGLSIVKHLVEAHGGRVSAESELGRGTRIGIWFPELRVSTPLGETGDVAAPDGDQQRRVARRAGGARTAARPSGSAVRPVSG